jgi:hypothetical protein
MDGGDLAASAPHQTELPRVVIATNTPVAAAAKNPVAPKSGL